jgi:FdhD protein
VIMRTPGHDRELAAGFLLSERVIQRPEDLLDVRVASDPDGLPMVNVVEMVLRAGLLESAERDPFRRNFIVSASCGFCGQDQIAGLLDATEPLTASDLRLSAPVLYELPERLRAAQSVFTHTGGLHAAGLFSPQGELLLLREDVGRHNAVDKLLGYGLLHRTLPYAQHILLVSGRTSFEIIQKALAARIPCVAAISAPSSLAVELAEQGGLTLIGFLRGHSMNVYTHPERMSLA